jgi:hypothetical protein
LSAFLVRLFSGHAGAELGRGLEEHLDGIREGAGLLSCRDTLSVCGDGAWLVGVALTQWRFGDVAADPSESVEWASPAMKHSAVLWAFWILDLSMFSIFPRARSEPGFGFCSKSVAKIRYRF